MRRKPGMSLEEFATYWADVHAPLMLSFAEKLGVVKYVQHHAQLPELASQMQGYRGTSAAYDGIAAISFNSLEDLARANVDPAAAEAQRQLAEDEANFIDIPNSSFMLSGEHSVI